MDKKEILLSDMENLQSNFAEREILTRKGVLGKIIQSGKKMIRRCLRWYMDPICEQQTAFNTQVTEGIRMCLNELSELRENTKIEISELKENTKADVVQSVQEFYENHIIGGNGFYSVSQSGEDGILKYILSTLHYQMEDVTYVDLGANHAQFLSNTYGLYTMGARGVLVEANPHIIPELETNRRGDIILNKCVGLNEDQEIDFYILNGDGLSTPSYEAAQECIRRNSDLEIVDIVKIRTIAVNDIFTRYLKKAPTVLNIDIEGNEIEILKSIDFEKYRPLVIICEMIEYRKELTVGEKNKDIMAFMMEQEYVEYANTGINSIFIDKKQVG